MTSVHSALKWISFEVGVWKIRDRVRHVILVTLAKRRVIWSTERNFTENEVHFLLFDRLSSTSIQMPPQLHYSRRFSLPNPSHQLLADPTDQLIKHQFSELTLIRSTDRVKSRARIWLKPIIRDDGDVHLLNPLDVVGSIKRGRDD